MGNLLLLVWHHVVKPVHGKPNQRYNNNSRYTPYKCRNAIIYNNFYLFVTKGVSVLDES